MDPYRPPAPQQPPYPPPNQGQAEGPSSNTYLIWMILGIASIFCGCGIFGIIPMGLGIAAFANKHSNPSTAKTLLRVTQALVGLGWVLFVLVVVASIVDAM